MSRDNDVTMVLAIKGISALFGSYIENASSYAFFGSMSSAVRSVTKIYKGNFEISWPSRKRV